METQSKTIFISYATQEDPAFVKRLREDLQSHGINVWLDKFDIRSRGKTFLQEIQDAIITSDRLILVVGPHSIESEYVQYEWQFANEHCIIINPVIRKGERDLLPPEISKLHIYDFRDDGNYRPTIDSLIAEIISPVEPLGDLIGFKSLPNPFINRSDAIQCLRDYIASDLLTSNVTMSYDNISAIYGMGGLGKSVVANALGRDCFIRRSFCDGIFWFSCGEKPDHEANLISILSHYNEAPSIHESLDNLISRVSRVFEDKRLLLILDDIHNSAGILPYMDIIKGQSRLLLTTREEGLAKRITGNRAYSLELLSRNDAKDLLYKKSSIPENIHTNDYDEIVELCGYLPLAIALCGGMIRESMPSKDLIDALKESDLEFVDTELPGYKYTNVYKAFMISLESIRKEWPKVADLYLSLAVFPKGESIPEKALFTYWNSTDGLKERDIRKNVSTIQSKALCNIVVDGADRFIEIHDLLHSFILNQCENEVHLHEKLIKCYKSKCSGNWASLQKDNYIYDHLTYHLCKADKLHDIIDLLSEEDKNNQNSWWTLKYGIDPSAKSYVADISLARKAFVSKDTTVAKSGNLPCPYLGQEIFTYVVQASLNSLFSKLSGQLTIDLIASGYWDTDDALSIAALITENMNRIDSYEKIAPLLNIDQLNEAIEEVKKTNETEDKSKLLSVLVPWITSSGEIKRAIETALSIEVDRHRNEAIKKIANILYDQDKMSEAYETITYLPRNYEYVDELEVIVDKLPDHLLKEALRDILEMPFEEKPSSPSGRFKANYDPKGISDDQVSRAVFRSIGKTESDSNGIYEDPSGASVRYVQPRATGVLSIISHLAKKGMIDEAAEAVATIENDDDRFEGYMMLVPYVSDEEKNFMVENVLSGETIVKPELIIKLLPYLIERKEYELVEGILFQVDGTLAKIECIKKIIDLADDEYVSYYAEKAVNIIKSIENFVYWRRIVETTGESLDENDRKVIIDDILNRILNVQIDEDSLNKALGYIAGTCSKIKYYVGLLQALQLINDESEKSDQLDRYINVLGEEHLHETVSFIQNHIENKNHDEFYNKLSSQLIQGNQLSKAAQILDLIKDEEEKQEGIKALNEKMHRLNAEETLMQTQAIDDSEDINYFLIDTVEFIGSKGFFDISYKCASSIPDIETRLDAFRKIISFADYSQLKELCEFIENIDFENNCDDFYSQCASRYAELESYDDVRSCLNNIENSEEREFAVKRLADSLARSGNYVEVRDAFI